MEQKKKVSELTNYKLFLSFFITALIFTANANLSSAQENQPTSRTSYWAAGGESLVEEKQEIPFIERKELFQKLKEKGNVLFLDTREPHEFQKSHLPNAQNVPFSKREEFIKNFKENPDQKVTIIPYCNWDFRAYVSALELKKADIPNVVMMYPHGFRGWEAGGLPLAGELPKQTDEKASAQLEEILQNPSRLETPTSQAPAPPRKPGIQQIDMRILKKKVEPDHIIATAGDHLILNLHAEEEDHWFVIPDFGVNVHLKPGESKTIELDIKRSGYFPYGCISCCSRYQCQVKQAIMVDLDLPPSFFGE